MKDNIRLFFSVVITCIVTVMASGASAKKTWKLQCANCHGNDGKGNTPVGKTLGVVDLTTKEFQESRNDEDLVKQIKEGSVGEDGITKMIPYKAMLSDEEISALVDLIRGLEKGKK